MTDTNKSTSKKDLIREEDEFDNHMRRATGILSFLQFSFRQWSEMQYRLSEASPEEVPSLEIQKHNVEGLTEILVSAEDALDLAFCAAKTIFQEAKRQAGAVSA